MEPASKIAEVSLSSVENPGTSTETETPPDDSSSKDDGLITEDAVPGGDVEQGAAVSLARVVSTFGDRPECFANTLQEMSFVLMATVATATTSFLAGMAQIITVAVSQDLKMTQGQIAWIAAATSWVFPPSPPSPFPPCPLRTPLDKPFDTSPYYRYLTLTG